MTIVDFRALPLCCINVALGTHEHEALHQNRLIVPLSKTKRRNIWKILLKWWEGGMKYKLKWWRIRNHVRCPTCTLSHQIKLCMLHHQNMLDYERVKSIGWVPACIESEGSRRSPLRLGPPFRRFQMIIHALQVKDNYIYKNICKIDK
jgi:hypothetical protein